MNIYKARYLNALKKAAKVNRLLKKGYCLFYAGVENKHGFFLSGDTLFLKITDTFRIVFFANDKDLDDGYYTKISDWNEEFNSLITIYQPNAKLLL